MTPKKLFRTAIFAAFIVLGAWFAFSAGFGADVAGTAGGPQAFAPSGTGNGNASPAADRGFASPVSVNLRDIPAGQYDPNNQLDRWRRGEIQLERGDSIIDRARMEDMRVESLNLPASANITLAGSETSPSTFAPAATGSGFDSIDYTECCGGGGNVPPDPELAVGPNHVIAVVNVALEIYDTNGNSLRGPITFDSFLNSTQCTGVFDPNANYDEQADRFILGIDSDGSGYCIAVSKTSDPTGDWWVYYFPTGNDFFDYPHAGVGNDAIYMGANMFGITCRGPFNCRYTFAEARIWAFDKNAMYAGDDAQYVTRSLGSQPDTPQPLNLHGWNTGTWPAGGPHYFFSNATYDGVNYNVYSWLDPFGANTLSTVGTVDLEAATGVSAGLPLDTPQLGGQTLQGNDFRPQDFEYHDGYGWSVMTIACNPGGGTVNCVRWAKIDLATATVADAGVYSSDGEYRMFGDLAVDACGNMAVGYTKSSSSMYPGIWYTGRLADDPVGTLQTETELKAGEISYTSFESSAPRRWGDYTEMTISPDGTTFWYLGEYSKITNDPDGRWGTYIGSFTYSCDPGNSDTPPTVTINSPTEGAPVSGLVNITATAIDDVDVTQVEFFVNGGPAIQAVENGNNEWSASWDSNTAPEGSATISAVATDTSSQTGSDSVNVTVDNDASPTVNIIAPGDGDPVSGTVVITASASDDVDVTQVEFFVNGGPAIQAVENGNNEWSASWDSNTAPEGSATISAVATDTIGQTGSDSVNVTVDNQADTVVHVAALTGDSVAARGGKWDATATITVVDSGGAAVANVTVTGDWSNGGSGSGSCVTNANGECTITNNNVRKNQNSIDFTVTDLSGSGVIYDSGSNIISSITITAP